MRICFAVLLILSTVLPSLTWGKDLSSYFYPPSHRRQPPSGLVKCLRIVPVEFYNQDKELAKGEVVVHMALVEDIKKLFSLIKREQFPITSANPIHLDLYQWSDAKSMAADNTSAYNFRTISGAKVLSYHALGRAIDINPKCNPYVRDLKQKIFIDPPGSRYSPESRCALSWQNPSGAKIIRLMQGLGWNWGGSWENPKDYQHFEKRSPAGNDPSCEDSWLF